MYKYGVIEKENAKKGMVVKAPQLLSIIKKEVGLGKWNQYDGGVNKKTPAKLSYKGKNWEYGEHLFIYGSKKDFKWLEKMIEGLIPIIPRKF